MKPKIKPINPCFSSGPCAKRPDWSIDSISNSLVGRSHRSSECKRKIENVIKLSKDLLRLPKDYICGIVPASDTGAIEMAMWSLLGSRPVDVLAWESFGKTWVSDIFNELKIKDSRKFVSDYGNLPDFSSLNFNNDILFTYNGTTSGVKLKNLDWIPDHRLGLTICDATSAVFSTKMDYNKLDVITWSWQKVMGGEAAHGMIALSPNAVQRLESEEPKWPMPKIFKLAKNKKLINGIFNGSTINTVSMICIEDALDGLNWAKSIGGLDELISRSNKNLVVIEDWVKRTNWVEFLANDPQTRSNTSICLKIIDPKYLNLSHEDQKIKAKEIASLLEEENVAYDISSYRDAPPGIRIWGGSTVESDDIRKLLPWLEWAYKQLNL